MNKKSSLKGALMEVYWGLILSLLGEISGSGAYQADGTATASVLVSAALSLIGLLFVLIGLRKATEHSKKYGTARLFIVINICWQIVAAILTLIGLTFIPAIDSVVSIVLDFLIVRAILQGNRVVNEKIGEKFLINQAKNLTVGYLASSVLMVLVSTVFGFIAYGSDEIMQTADQSMLTAFFGAYGAAGILLLIVSLIYLVTYIMVLGNIRKTAVVSAMDV